MENNDNDIKPEENENKINNVEKKVEKEEKKIINDFKNKGILLIFNKL